MTTGRPSREPLVSVSFTRTCLVGILAGCLLCAVHVVIFLVASNASRQAWMPPLWMPGHQWVGSYSRSYDWNYDWYPGSTVALVATALSSLAGFSVLALIWTQASKLWRVALAVTAASIVGVFATPDFDCLASQSWPLFLLFAISAVPHAFVGGALGLFTPRRKFGMALFALFAAASYMLAVYADGALAIGDALAALAVKSPTYTPGSNEYFVQVSAGQIVTYSAFTVLFALSVYASLSMRWLTIRDEQAE